MLKSRAQTFLVILLILLLVVTAIIVLYYIPEFQREEPHETFPENQEGEILTKTFSPEVARLYITPNEPIVQQTLDNILKNDLIPDWIEIRDWVGSKVEYRYDSEVHGVSEYWQLPRETLSLKTGDCEDFSILLCTLLRVNGWDEDEVYVVLGEKHGNYHAWVKLNVDIIGWQNIEPQEGALNTFMGDFFSLSGYTAKYNFNDVYFKTL